MAGLGATADRPTIAMVPAMFAVTLYGKDGATRLVIFSQVVLSLQLPFAVYPLVRFTNSRAWMGALVNRRGTAVRLERYRRVSGLNTILLVGVL